MNNLAAFDYISDLNLTSIDQLSLEDKPTALFCIVGGGISSDMYILKHTLLHLSQLYKGVFYIDGALEHANITKYNHNIDTISRFIDALDNVAYLHTNVIVVDGIALVGVNGWYGNHNYTQSYELELAEHFRHQDTVYLCKSVERLQRHPDVKQIIVVSNSIPSPELSFGTKKDLPCEVGLQLSLLLDTESKIKHWLYGSYPSGAQVTKGDILYINNPLITGQDYHPKRVQFWY